MSINSLNLDAFYACVQAGNFTTAATRLHITQSALSQRVKNLEEELGSTLLLRDRNGVRLTEFGESLLRYCQEREEAEQRVLSALKPAKKGLFTGHLAIGAFSTVGRSLVLPAMSQLLIENPEVHFKLVVRELRDLSSLLRTGEINFLLSTEAVDLNGVTSRKIGEEVNVLVQRCGYSGPDLILDHDESDRTSAQFFGKGASELKRRYLNDIYGILDGVAIGLGRAVVPLHLLSDYPDIEIAGPAGIAGSNKRSKASQSASLKVPVYLSHFERTIPSRLHDAVVKQLEKIFLGVSKSAAQKIST